MRHKPILLPITLILLITATVILTSTPIRAQQPNRVALIVNFDDIVLTRCVTFDEPELTGYDVLERSGLSFVASFESGDGAAVCKIEDTGCSAESCLLCRAPLYWSYWQYDGTDWLYANRGSSNTTVQDGSIEGWSWGNGDPPPVIPFDDICAPATPTPTSAPPTTTPTPSPPTATLQAVPEASFKLDANPVQAGECTTVRWETINAQSAFLDSESVDLAGNQEVCPESDQSLTLRVVNDHTEQSYTLVLGVVTLATTSTPQPTSTPLPDATSTPKPPTTTTPLPTSTPIPSPTPLPTQPPTSSISPIATPQPVANQMALQSPLPTPTSRATIVPAPPTPTATIVPVSPMASTPDVTNYLIFGLMTGLLLIGLGVRGLRLS